VGSIIGRALSSLSSSDARYDGEATGLALLTCCSVIIGPIAFCLNAGFFTNTLFNIRSRSFVIRLAISGLILI